MNVFESLENLQVSEECFKDILSRIEEDLEGRYVRTKVSDNLRKDADNYIKKHPEEYRYATLSANKKYPSKEESAEGNNNKKVSSAKAYELVGGPQYDGEVYDKRFKDQENIARREGRSFSSVIDRQIPTKQSKINWKKSDIENLTSSVKRHLRKIKKNS